MFGMVHTSPGEAAVAAVRAFVGEECRAEEGSLRRDG